MLHEYIEEKGFLATSMMIEFSKDMGGVGVGGADGGGGGAKKACKGSGFGRNSVVKRFGEEKIKHNKKK